jgi:CelD/BcsL family acetyltransferase involved in cellulose biosynthesis
LNPRFNRTVGGNVTFDVNYRYSKIQFEGAGTSLTANTLQENFHSRLAPIAAATDMFRGYILYLNGAPIAHVFGMLCDGVFYSLKLSYSEDYRKYSPGIVTTALVIQKLILERVKFWDFAGPTEDYKRRWTGKSYSLRTLTFFSQSPRGKFLKLRRKIRGLISS